MPSVKFWCVIGIVILAGMCWICYSAGRIVGYLEGMHNACR